MFYLRTAVVLAASMIAAAAAAEEIEIVADLFSSSPVTLEQQAENSSFEEYMKRHPNVRIRPFTSLQVTGAANRSGKLMAAAGGTPPDIWQMWFHETLKYSGQGFLLPLNKYIFDKNGKVKYKPWNDIPDEFKAGCIKDGRVYALPVYTGGSQVLNYRTDLFRQAGLDPDRPPLNWDELWRFAQKLTLKPNEVPGKPRGQSGLYFMSPGFLCFNPLVWAAGGELVRHCKVDPATGKKIVLNQDESYPPGLEKVQDRWFAAFNSPEGMRAVKFIHRLRWQRWAKDPKTGEPFDLTPEQLDAGRAKAPSGVEIELSDDTVYTGVLYFGAGSSEDSNIYKQIADGRIGMFFGYNDDAAKVISQYSLSPEQFGQGPMPAAPGCAIVGSSMPYMLGISLKKRTPEAEAAAWNIIRDYSSKANIVRRTRIMVEGGRGRMVPPLFLKAAGYAELFNSLPESWRNLPEIVKKNRTDVQRRLERGADGNHSGHYPAHLERGIR